MTDTVLTVQDMIKAASQGSPSGFEDAFNSMLMPKIAAALDAKRTEVAQNYFEPQQADTEVEDQDENTENNTGSSEETSASHEG